MTDTNASSQATSEDWRHRRKTIAVAMAFNRWLWDVTFSRDRITVKSKAVSFDPAIWDEEISRFLDHLKDSRQTADRLLDRLATRDLVRRQSRAVQVARLLYRPFPIAGEALQRYAYDPNLEYEVWRCIREKYASSQTLDTVHRFHSCASSLNSALAQSDFVLQGDNRPGGLKQIRTQPLRRLHLADEFLECLRHAFDATDESSDLPSRFSQLFMECSIAVGYIDLDFRSRHIHIATPRFDAEFMLSKLFGLPTSILGLDELFGGGGIVLPESLACEAGDISHGRALLINGRFGTGKSSLAMLLAAEVANKGGLAWVMPLEQLPRECLHCLESLGAMSGDPGFDVALDARGAMQFLRGGSDEAGHQPHRGAIALLPSPKGDLRGILRRVVEPAQDAADSQYSLRLFVLDPINAIFLAASDDPIRNRGQLLGAIRDVRAAGANLLLVGEEDDDSARSLRFAQNVCDTVINLSVEWRHSYSERYVEILKSRLQREHRGRHPFSIKSGRGITIYPSPAAVNARLRSRQVRVPETPSKFGWNPLDSILGDKAVFARDLIVLRGPEGMLKTHVGLLFALATDPFSTRGDPRLMRSLIIPIRDSQSSIERLLQDPFEAAFRKECARTGQRSKRRQDLIICELPIGFVYPGEVLQAIEAQFALARAAGYKIDRVLIDNLGHWELACPFIREDATFADTLIQLLRRHEATACFICGEKSSHPDGVLQRALEDDANTLIEFSGITFRGTQRRVFRVLKSRGMRHARERYDLNLEKSGLQIGHESSLLRIGVGGAVGVIQTRLFLHSANHIQDRYNDVIAHSLRNVLSPHVHVESQNRVDIPRAGALTSLSALDELHVLQLSEVQFRGLVARRPEVLTRFPRSAWDKDWDDVSKDVKARAHTPRGDFFGVPYFTNLGMLTFRDDLKKAQVSNWQEIANLCRQWEGSHKSSAEDGQLFFDAPCEVAENYNCLFLEILLSDGDQGVAKEGLSRLLACEKALEAMNVFRTLCRRSYYLRRNLMSSTEGQKERHKSLLRPAVDAIVVRHWFTTLSATFDLMSQEQRRHTKVCFLPNNVSIAGEWYLAIPRFSSATETGLEIIRMLTTAEAEIERLHRGVGLPVRQALYQSNAKLRGPQPRISPMCPLSVKQVSKALASAVRRSSFKGYERIAPVLTYFLHRVVEVDGEKDGVVMRELKRLQIELVDRSGLLLAKSARGSR